MRPIPWRAEVTAKLAHEVPPGKTEQGKGPPRHVGLAKQIVPWGGTLALEVRSIRRSCLELKPYVADVSSTWEGRRNVEDGSVAPE